MAVDRFNNWLAHSCSHLHIKWSRHANWRTITDKMVSSSTCSSYILSQMTQWPVHVSSLQQ